MSAPTSLRTSAGKLARFLHRFGPLVRAQRRLLVGAALLIVADVGLKLLEPWPLGLVLDEVVAKKPSGRLPGWLAGATDGELLAGCVAAVVLIALVRALAAYLSTVFLALAGNRVLTAVRSDLYRHVQRLSLRFHARARTGDLITRLTGDVGRLQEVAVTAALPLVINTATLLSMCVLMLVMNVQLALVAMASLPLISPTFVRRSGDIRRVARRQRAREGAMATVAAESLAAMKLVQALGLERTLERAFASQNTASLKEGVKAKKLAAGLERKVDVLTAIGTAMVLLFGARQVRSGSLSPGELVVFMLYLKTAFKPMQDLAKYTGRIAQASASAERILELLDTRPEITDAPDAVDAPRLRGALGLEHVTFGYEPGRPVLRNVSLHVPEGRMIALVGPSGAGKSSVLGLLLRLWEPSDGRVCVDAWDVRELTLESLRSQVAVVLQETALFGVSVRDNIRYGAPGATDQQIEEAARLAGAAEFIEALPEGYDTVLGERGATLSGGQRQRIAIARAAVRDAPIVLLDEPTTGLDEASRRAVTTALERLTRDRTTVLITHDLEPAERADEILYIDRGEILERGSHEELLALDGAYAAVHRLQTESRAAGVAAEAWEA